MNNGYEKKPIVLVVMLCAGLAIFSCDNDDDSSADAGDTDTNIGPIDDDELPEVDTNMPEDTESDPGPTEYGDCVEVELGSGYPAACNPGAPCADGSECGKFSGMEMGACMPTCATDDDCVVPMNCWAAGKCTSLTSGGNTFSECLYTCTSSSDCPPNMGCFDGGGVTFCVDISDANMDIDTDTDSDTDTDTDTDIDSGVDAGR